MEIKLRARGFGKTTEFADSAGKHPGATILCRNQDEAERLRKRYRLTNEFVWPGKKCRLGACARK